MRLIQASVVVMALAASTAFAQDADRKVAGGGITAKGWQGKIDPGPCFGKQALLPACLSTPDERIDDRPEQSN